MKFPRPRGPSNPRWLLVMLLLLLTGGALVNVAVAWSWPLWPAVDTYETIPSSAALADWQDWAPDGWAHHRSLWVTSRNGCLTWEMGFRAPEEGKSDKPDEALAVYSEGWPLRSLQGCMQSHRARWATMKQGSGFTVTSVGGREYFYALRPIWPGFAINTMFYAAILWGLFAAPFVLRRHVRSKRGLCPACAYPVGGSDVCTECGRAVPSPSGRGL